MSDEEKTLLDVDLCTEGHRSVLERTTREGGHASHLGGSKCEHLTSLSFGCVNDSFFMVYTVIDIPKDGCIHL